MQVSYENTRADTFALFLNLTPKQRANRIVAAVFLLAMLISILRVPLRPPSMLGYAILVVFTCVIWLLAMLLITIATVFVTAATSRNKGFLCRHTVHLSPESFIEESPSKRGEWKWDGLHGVVETKKHLFILTSEASGHVVPRRAFSSQSEWEAFCSYCLDTFNAHVHRD